MNKNFRTVPAYDTIYGVDVVDAKGHTVVNFRTYAAAKLYMDKVSQERARVIRENNVADMRVSKVANDNLHRSKWNQLPLPEVHHKRPPALVSLRYYAPGKAPLTIPG